MESPPAVIPASGGVLSRTAASGCMSFFPKKTNAAANTHPAGAVGGGSKRSNCPQVPSL